MSFHNLTKLASGSVKNINDLSKQLSKSVKSHAQSADTLAKESKRIAKASNAHSKQVKALAKVKDKAVARTNLAKLANAMNQQSEQEKKPSKATYIPAALGVLAGADALQDKGVDEKIKTDVAKHNLNTLQDKIKRYAEPQGQLKTIGRTTLGEEHKLVESLIKDINERDRRIATDGSYGRKEVEKLLSEQGLSYDDLQKEIDAGRFNVYRTAGEISSDSPIAERFNNLTKRINVTAHFGQKDYNKREKERLGRAKDRLSKMYNDRFGLKSFRTDLDDLYKKRALLMKAELDEVKAPKRVLSKGLGALGVGLATTALLRRRKKRKQEQR